MAVRELSANRDVKPKFIQSNAARPGHYVKERELRVASRGPSPVRLHVKTAMGKAARP